MIMDDIKYPDIRVKLTGTDGNAYALSTHARHDWPGARHGVNLDQGYG